MKYLNQLNKNDDLKEEFKTLAKTMYQQSELYIWMVLLMSIYYSIPAIQLVLKGNIEFTTQISLKN